jgi:L-fuculose-phosphate aldolase
VSLPQALALAIEVETLARMYLQARLLGEPPLLSGEQIAAVERQFVGLSYGQADAP